MRELDFSHAYVVPAYRYSPHLGECLDSLLSQTLASDIKVVTSTPHPEAEAECTQRGIPYITHNPNRGIGPDWNAALRSTNAKWVTVAHQDDLYYSDFTASVRDVATRDLGDEVVMMFCDYDEFTNEALRPKSRLLWIKTLLLHFGFVGRSAIRDGFSKRNALRFACPIPCPAVTINSQRMHDGFDETFEINLDWATWINAADKPGYFVWIRRKLMGHRIHDSSETSAAILDGRRKAEDFRILSRLWPNWIAKRIVGSYGLAYSSNETE